MPTNHQRSCARVFFSVRGAVVLLTTASVVATSVVIFLLVLTDASRSRQALSDSAQEAVDGLAELMVQQSLSQATIPIWQFFQSAFEVATELKIYTQYLAAARNGSLVLDAATRKEVLAYLRRVLASYEAPQDISLLGADGAGSVAGKGPYSTLEIPSAPEGQTPTGVLSLWADPSPASPLIPVINMTIDPRLIPSYTSAATFPPGEIHWVQPSVVGDGIVLGVGSGFYPDATVKPGKPMVIASVGCSTAWLSQELQQVANRTGSIAILTLADGTLVGNTHGSTLTPVMKDVYTTMHALDSPVPSVRDLARLCLPTNATAANIMTIVTTNIAGFGEVLHSGIPCQVICASQRMRDAHGSDFRFAMATPRSYFFGKLESSRDAEDKRARRNTRTTVGICVAVLSASIILAIAVALVVTRPLREIADTMGSVADMQLDKTVFTRSRLAEVSAIQHAFECMVARLKEYKAFIPAGVFMDEHEMAAIEASAEDDTEIDETHRYGPNKAPNSEPKGKTHQSQGQLQIQVQRAKSGPQETQGESQPTYEAPGIKAKIGGAIGIARNASSGTVHSTGSSKSRSSHRTSEANLPVQRARRDLGVSLQFRDATVAVVDLRQFNHCLLAQRPLREVTKLYGLYVESVIGVTKTQRGSVDAHIGDKVYLSWNTFLGVSGHRTLACRAMAALLNEKIPQINRSSGVGVDARAGVASGVVAWGRVGCDSTKLCTVMGTPVNRAALLSKHAATCEVTCLVGPEIVDEASLHVILRPLDLVQFDTGAGFGCGADTFHSAIVPVSPSPIPLPSSPGATKSEDGPVVVHQLLAERPPAEDEWMYSLQDNDSSDQKHLRGTLLQAFQLVRQAKYRAACELLPETASSLTYTLRRLQAMSRCESPLPVRLTSRAEPNFGPAPSAELNLKQPSIRQRQ